MSKDEWCKERNKHVSALRILSRGGSVEIGTFLAAAKFAAERLDGLPEHWQAVESPDETIPKPEKCPECGMSPAFDGMWHKP